MTTLETALIFLTLILWFWAIMDIARSRFKNLSMKTIWLLIVLFFPILGPIFYFQLRKKFVINQPRRFQPDFSKTRYNTID